MSGEKRTETTHKENGVNIKLDVEKCYFSPRLSQERLRIAKLVKNKFGAELTTDHLLGFESFWCLVQAIDKAQSVDPNVVKNSFEKMTKIETPFGPGTMGGKETYGINHIVVRPLPVVRFTNGEHGLFIPGNLLHKIGLQAGSSAIFLESTFQVAEFFERIAQAVVGVGVRRVIPDSFEHFHSRAFPLFGQKESDSHLAVEVGILRVQRIGTPQVLDRFLDASPGAELDCLLNVPAQSDLDLGRRERCGGRFRCYRLFYLVADLHVLSRAWRDEVCLSVFVRTADVNVVIAGLKRGHNESPCG
jgi:hypothetical protein